MVTTYSPEGLQQLWGQGTRRGGTGESRPVCATQPGDPPASGSRFPGILGNEHRLVQCSKCVDMAWFAWHLFMAVLLGKQIVFMSERRDRVWGQGMQLVRSNHTPGPSAKRGLGPLGASSLKSHLGVTQPLGKPHGVCA